MEYFNRHKEKYTFTLNRNGDILWEGDFLFSRRLFDGETMETQAVDPSGGPFISVGTDMVHIHESFDGLVVQGFEQINNGYKILIKK